MKRAAGRHERAATALAVTTIALCALALLWRPVLLGEVYLPADAVLHAHPWRYSYERVPVNNPIFADQIRQIYPRRLLVNQIIARGELPLWNATVLSGMPMLDDGQLALFYPPSLIFLIAPLDQAFGYYAYLQLVLAGLGGYAFTRRLGLERGPATIAGVAYMLNGHMQTWLQFPHHSGAQAMLPWSFWAIERAIERRTWRAWALAGVPLALLLLTQLQLAFYAYTALGCYALYRMTQLPEWPARLRVLIGFSGAVGVAVLLGAVQLLPAAALSAQGQRSDVGFNPPPAEEFAVTLLRLAFPAIGGAERIGPAPLWGPPLVQVTYPYIGIPILLLALIGAWMARRRGIAFFTLLAVISFALALRTPLLELLFTLLPPYRQFDIHLRWFMLWGLAAAVLAGFGVQALRPPAPTATDAPPRMLSASRIVVLLTLGIAGGWMLQHLALFTPESRYGLYVTLVRQQSLLVPAILVAASLALIGAFRWRRIPATPLWLGFVVLTTFDLCWHGGGFNTSYHPLTRPTTDLVAALDAAGVSDQERQTLYPPTRQITFLQQQPGPFRILGADYDVLTPNFASAFGLEDIRGYMSLYSERYNRLARLIDGKDYTRTGEGTASLRVYFSTGFRQRRLLDMLNVRYVIFGPGMDAAPWEPLELVHESDEGRVYRNPTALPRAWLVYRAEVMATDDEQLRRMAMPDFDPATQAVAAQPIPPLGPPPAVADPVPLVRVTANTVTIEAEPAAPALLVLADSFYDGWEVWVDGKPATIQRVNYALRGVVLTPGRHTVEFVYRPWPLLIGGGVSLTTLVILLIAGVTGLARRSPTSHPVTSGNVVS